MKVSPQNKYFNPETSVGQIIQAEILQQSKQASNRQNIKSKRLMVITGINQQKKTGEFAHGGDKADLKETYGRAGFKYTG